MKENLVVKNQQPCKIRKGMGMYFQFAGLNFVRILEKTIILQESRMIFQGIHSLHM